MMGTSGSKVAEKRRRAETDWPFPDALELLAAQQGVEFHTGPTRGGQLNIEDLARRIPKLNMMTLRRLHSGTRAVRPDHLEAIAEALGVEPEFFAEYRLWKAREALDPRVVGFDAAMNTLDRLGRV